jgi:uncharacterized protein YlxW (UPF0749 family)
MKKALSIAIVCLLLGIMVSAQYRSSQSGPVYLASDRWEEIAIRTQQLENQHDALTNEIVALEYKINNATASERKKALEEMLNKANIAAGTIPIAGPGIVITLGDAPDPLQQNIASTIIDYWLILPIINELNAAGAEAVSINGERMVAGSAISQDGSIIMVNHQPITLPIEMKAIGDQKNLENSLYLKGGVMQALLLSGIKVDIQKYSEVEIPAYTHDSSFHYAEPGQVL